jgi:hypothetical protein
LATAGNSERYIGRLRSAGADHALIRLLLPSLSTMLAAATLLYCLFVFNAGQQLFRDSDTGWHVRNGESILATGQLPHTDPYSFSKPDAPWIAWEWGSDVVMALVHQAGGFYGLTVLFTLMIVLVTWMACRLHLDSGGDFFLTALLAIPMVTTSSLHWLARPHIFGWVFALAAVRYAERAPLRFGWTQALTIALGSALWANLHGSFFLGIGIAALYAVAHFVRPFIWDVDAHADRMRARWFGLAALAALLGSAFNPYGLSLHSHILSYLANRELTSRIAEFQSFNFFEKEAFQVVIAVSVTAAGAVLAFGQKRLAQFFLMAILVWSGLRSARMLPLVALIALPLANGAISAALRRASNLQPRLQGSLSSLLQYSTGLRKIDEVISGALFLVILIAGSLLALHAPANVARMGFPADRFPVEAASAIAKLPPDARVYSPDNFGGYLIYRFAGQRKVFFDGRSDFYGVDFMKDYLKLRQAQPGWQDIAARYQFTHALLPAESALGPALAARGWVERYQDNTASLWEAR